ncbi:hypothetical protein AB0K52_22295 [Glycomyces sp. NPDC049804]|uniref:hypothetical protein n=1 Tax=Glycomyces sp. NPDC049804 TaxID=3154363 RepID=UPI00341F47A2
MTHIDTPAIRLVIDECEEIFGGDREASDAFESAVADALALLDQNPQQPADER